MSLETGMLSTMVITRYACDRYLKNVKSHILLCEENRMEYLFLEEIKNIELNLLIEFDRFCKTNNLKYSLAYGTLLGAIRHKDFIPWDDDIDVMMPREDYNRFFKLTKTVSIGKNIKVLTSENKGYYYHFNKICDENTVAKMSNNVTNHGIWLDVFPVDNVPDNKLKAKIFHVKARMLRNMIIAGTTDFSGKIVGKTTVKKILSILTNMVGISKVSNYLNRYVQKYNKQKCTNVSIIHGQYDCNADFPYDCYFTTSEKEFRNHLFPVPKEYDRVLRGLYGEYMVIPDINHQNTHYLKAYYKDI